MADFRHFRFMHFNLFHIKNSAVCLSNERVWIAKKQADGIQVVFTDRLGFEKTSFKYMKYNSYYHAHLPAIGG
ncbi:MAG TPA: hypothetical protein VHP58_03065 [Alphaproteobacteria bacterium]|nr:hypothetical protein [Alphaproteobacteria bacterium]